MNDFFASANNFLTANPALAKLASNTISNLTSSPKSAPKLVTQAPAVQTVVAPSSGMSTGMMIAIGAAVVGVAVLMFTLLRGK